MTRAKIPISLLATVAGALSLGGAAILIQNVSAQTRPAPLTPPVAPSSVAPRPNIVFILADDLGWADVGYHGQEIKTPHIDSLAAGGVRLEQFYVQPLCTPSRAALMTGRYPMRQGLQVGVVRPWARYGLPLGERTLAQALGAAGYETAITGKWHLGHANPAYLPTRRGFDHQYGSYVSSDHYAHTPTTKDFQPLDWHRNDKALREEGYSSDLVTREAQKIIRERNTAKPLFLYVAYNTPHIPLQAPSQYLQRYAHIANPRRRTYAAMVSAMDDGIGRLLATLDEKGLRDNTLIVFSSDNGGWYRNGGGANNLPLRGQKGTLYEGGVRVPTLVSWRGKLKPRIVNEPLHMVDWYPTFVKLAGGSLQQPLPLDGRDAWPAIASGAPSPHEEILLNVSPNSSALRRGEWKLIVNTHDQAADAETETDAASAPGVELFHMAKDPFEKTNVAAQNPALVASLRARLDAFAKQALPPRKEGRASDVAVPQVLGEIAANPPDAAGEGGKRGRRRANRRKREANTTAAP
ncbi:MAG: arylsulfatase [Armatimonadetes bacterium]|nr:arylsulfatase [Armatimonadota bacterium]